MDTASTKERILDVAFSFYRAFIFENVSLSQIAGKVGITKAAIFKHFKNKEALFQAMNDRMFTELALVLRRMEDFYAQGKSEEALSSVITYLVNHREYLFYIISTVPVLTEDVIFNELQKRGVKVFDGIFGADGTLKDKRRYFTSIFASTTFFCFLMLWFHAESEGIVSQENSSEFVTKFHNFINKGLDVMNPVTDIFHLAELDEMCSQKISNIPPMNRMFVALTSVIFKSGFPGITMDALADELGMAKSSLYSLFRSKKDMLHTLIFEEMGNLYDTILKSMNSVSSSGEKIYVMFQTEILYYISRPQILVILQGIFFSGEMLKKREMCEESPFRQFDRVQLLESLPDLGLPNINDRVILSWLMALPTMLYMHCKNNSFSNDIIHAAIKDLYFMAAFGMSRSF